MEKKTRNKKTTYEKPISLYPLEPEKALKKLLEVSPPKKGKKKRKPTRSSE